MRTFLASALLIVAAGLAGCGGGNETITDPSELPPLTESDYEEIKQIDEQIEQDERTGGGMVPQ